MKDLVIEESKKQSYKLAALSFLMVAGAGLMVWIGYRESDFLYLAIGIVGILFFGICFLYTIGRVLKTRPLLVIKKDGVVDTSSAAAFGDISFDQIEQFKLLRLSSQHYIGIELKDAEGFMENLSGYKKKNLEANMKMGNPPLVIRVFTAKDKSGEEILVLLREALREYREKHE